MRRDHREVTGKVKIYEDRQKKKAGQGKVPQTVKTSPLII